ncbi:MAG TPA: hypothetical protein VEA38_14500 [Terriglobales bacterium]|nr:hypothetical protein [Terriglobales bacterium]
MGSWTFSSAYVLIHCAYPFRSDVVVPEDTSPSAARDKGTSNHACGATYINSKRYIEALKRDEHLTWANMAGWIDTHWKPSWVAEPAYAWDPAAATARMLGVDINREYEKHGKLPHERAGTCDVVSVEGDTVYVYEFGTGYDIEHKAEQLRICCAVAAKAHGKTRAVGQLVKFRDEGAYPSPPVTFDAFALAAIEEEFATRLATVEGSAPSPGEHCKRCNAVPICPEASKAVDALVPGQALLTRKPFDFSLTVRDGDHARWMLERLKLIKTLHDRHLQAIKDACPEGGWELADGSVLVEGRRTVERFSKARAVALLRELGATDEQVASLDVPSEESSGLRVTKPRKGKAA